MHIGCGKEFKYKPQHIDYQAIALIPLLELIDCLGLVGYLEFVINPVKMLFDCARRNIELISYFLVKQPFRD